jgi:protein ImuB
VLVLPGPGCPALDPDALVEIARTFSPRYERHRDDLVSIDVTGLERLMRSSVRAPESLGPRVPELPRPAWRTIGDELVRASLSKGMRAQVAIAGTRSAALVLAHARPGLTVIAAGQETAALQAVPIDVLAQVAGWVVPPPRTSGTRGARRAAAEDAGVATFKQWGVRTLGELAALPAPDLMMRLGRPALVWQAIARGEDVRPLVPAEPDERFESTIELEWPIEGVEPLSFVLTRLLEPLSTQLERRDRGAAVLHVMLDLVTREVQARHLQLPSPLRDVRTLRTLALLDIESHPPSAAIDRVTVVIDPTPGRVVQHTLFSRTLPTPERLSTLLARLAAVMGQDRIGAPAPVDSYRPGAFTLRPFATVVSHQASASGSEPVSAFRRCRHPVPARVAVEAGCPVHVTSDRRGFAGGSVVAVTGPWRTSGEWWAVGDTNRADPSASPWDRDEWDVALSDGARYRVFRDRRVDAWFIDGMFD